jgi:hypothetical protein
MEYEKLKEEQLRRIEVRDNLIYATLGSVGTVVAIASTSSLRLPLLLLLPPVCVVLGWTYLMNDQKVSAIGNHVRVMLIPHLQESVTGGRPVFTWESVHRADGRRRSRKFMQLLVDLLTFCAPGAGAIVLLCFARPRNSGLLVMLAVDVVLVLVLAYQIVVHAELKTERVTGEVTGQYAIRADDARPDARTPPIPDLVAPKPAVDRLREEPPGV